MPKLLLAVTLGLLALTAIADYERRGYVYFRP